MEFYNLNPHITAFTTDRTVGRDETELRRFIDFKNFCYPHQTHTDNVQVIEHSFFLLSEAEQKNLLEGIDALISNIPEVCIGISTADCIPIIVYDPRHHCAAAIHAGWRGTVAHIVTKTMSLMTESYGTDASDCTAVIGPGISQRSFEVGWEVYDQFVSKGFDMKPVTITLPAKDGNGTKPHIDLKEINRQQLITAGVRSENIMVSDIDTFTDKRFFSARREQTGNVKCGRILSGFVLDKIL